MTPYIASDAVEGPTYGPSEYPGVAAVSVPPRFGVQTLSAAVELESRPEEAFALLCAVEKWPVWLSLLRTAELVDSTLPLSVGSEVRVHSLLPGEPEQLFEVDRLIGNHHLSLVGAYSNRRRLDFRIERKWKSAKLHARIEYPAYGGRFGAVLDRLRRARTLARQFADSVLHFKHLAEYQRSHDAALEDF